MSPKSALSQYVRHAELFGGFLAVWETAQDLDAVALGELAVRLRELAQRQRRVGRKGRKVQVESFRLNAQETAALVRRLGEAGVSDTDACRYAGISRTRLGALRRGLDPRNSPEIAPVSPQIIRDKATDVPTASCSAGRHRSRTCEWCSKPLPLTLRSDARFCVGSGCRKAASRARAA
jgi:hypothetical protein